MIPEMIAHDPVLADLYRYWYDRRVGDLPPTRESVDPLDIPRHVLPHLMLVELEGALPRIRYRLVGTAIAAKYGEEFTGRYLDEVAGAGYRGLLERLYGLMRETGRPVYVTSQFRLDPETAAETVRMYLPLTSDGEIRMSLAVQTFPTYPYDERNFFPMIRDAPGSVQHREWLIDPATGNMEPIGSFG